MRTKSLVNKYDETSCVELGQAWRIISKKFIQLVEKTQQAATDVIISVTDDVEEDYVSEGKESCKQI